MTSGLAGRTVALAEGRQLEELAAMLEKEGAIPMRCPMLGIRDAPDAGPVLDWLHALTADRFAYVILMTGEALTRLLSFADDQGQGLRDRVVAALGRTRVVTRGPKPIRALKAIGLAPAKVAAMPTTEGIIECLRDETLKGLTVGVTLYGQPNPTLVQYMESAGASVQTVMPYVYAPAAEADQVVDLIHRMGRAEVDVVIFTSSAQADRLFEVAGHQGVEDVLRRGLEQTRVAAVGPVVAENLTHRGVRVDVCPEQGFVMKNLVQLIKRDFEAR